MKIAEVINQKRNGLYFNSRVILPFHAHFLKIIVDDEIYTDFSNNSKNIFISEENNFTNIYFRDFRTITDAISKYEAIKVVAVDKGLDVFDFKNHLKLVFYPEDNHNLRIEFTDEDILLIE